MRVEAPRGDRSVLPPGRHYVLRLRLHRPTAVAVDGAAPLPSANSDTGEPGWWIDAAGFVCVRPPASSPFTCILTY